MEPTGNTITWFNIHYMHLNYKSRADTIEKFIESINEILQRTIGVNNEFAQLKEDYEKSKEKHYDDKECIVRREDSAPYEFLVRPKNFNGKLLNIETIDNDIINLKQKADENRAIGELFAAMEENDFFKTDPFGYIEQWKNSMDKNSASQNRVLRYFNSKTPTETVIQPEPSSCGCIIS